MVPPFMNLICSMVLENMATFVFVWERWLRFCLSPDAELVNKHKSLPDASACKPNRLQQKRL